MKKPKIDLSKDGLQRFFLYHVEKLILLLAIVGFAVFMWLGLSTEKFADSDPQQLNNKAASADSHLKDNESWNKVVELRVARDKAPNIIENTKDLVVKDYPYGYTLGSPIKSLGLRRDVDIALCTPQQVETDAFRSLILIDKGRRTSPLDDLDPARKRGQTEDDGDDEAVYGDRLADLQSLEVEGIQPPNAAISPGRHMSFATNLVSIRALIDYEKFWADYDSKLEDAVGYFPGRDRPKFQLVQVQRKIGDEDWKDITLRNLPLAKAAPEVVAIENFDRHLCGPIPPIAMMDYRPYAVHSKLNQRSFKKLPEPRIDQDETDEELVNQGAGGQNRDDDFFGNDDSQEEDSENEDQENDQVRIPIKSGSNMRDYDMELDVDGPAATHKVVRFFDVNVPNSTDVQYRFRVWVDDPNNELVEDAEGGSRRGRNGNGGENNRRGAGGGIGAAGGAGGASGGFGGGGIEGGGGGEGDGRGGGIGQIGGAGRGGAGGLGGGGRGGKTGGGLGGAGNGPNQPVYREVPITESMLDIAVRNRIDQELEDYESDEQLQEFFGDVLQAKNVDLRSSRATDWVEVTVSVPDLEGSFAVAGNVSGRSVKDREGQYVLIEDPSAEILVADWSRKLGALISTDRKVFRGDFLANSLADSTNILNLVEFAVYKLEEYEFRSRRLVLDIMGGELIPVPRMTRTVRYESPIKSYNTPGEILVMDLDGKFSVRSTSEDRGRYLNWRFQEDETSEYNAAKRRRRNRGRGGDDDDGEGEGGGLPSGRGGGR